MPMPQKTWNAMKPRRILHIGAQLCQERKNYQKTDVGHVLWVEANPALLEIAAANIADCPGHQLVHAMVSNKEGDEADFHIANNNGASSSMLPLGTHQLRYPKVKYVGTIRQTTTTIDRLLEQHADLKPDLLVMDIQGAELLALQGASHLLASPDLRHIYLEVSYEEIYEGCPQLSDITAFLEPRGFTLSNNYPTSHGWGDALYTRTTQWRS